jgi:hypothetical protein
MLTPSFQVGICQTAKTLILFACLWSGEFPFLPPLHSSKHHHGIGNFNITNQPEVIYREFLPLVLRSMGKGADRPPFRKKRCQPVFLVAVATARHVWRISATFAGVAPTKKFIDQIKTIVGSNLKKSPQIIWPSKFPSAFLV